MDLTLREEYWMKFSMKLITVILHLFFKMGNSIIIATIYPFAAVFFLFLAVNNFACNVTNKSKPFPIL
jgi:predicted LPLAT superfamily acyltransferase